MLEIILKRPELPEEKAEREVLLGFYELINFFCTRDKLLIHLSVSSHQRKSS